MGGQKNEKKGIQLKVPLKEQREESAMSAVIQQQLQKSY